MALLNLQEKSVSRLGGRMSGNKKRSAPLEKISEEMKIWSGLLAKEVEGWPELSTKPMFGLTALYRGKAIFAALPKTRGMGSANAVAFKLADAPAKLTTKMRRDARINETTMGSAKWFVFEMGTEEDLQGVLEWLGLAYAAVGIAR
jgi:hypothetical protein